MCVGNRVKDETVIGYVRLLVFITTMFGATQAIAAFVDGNKLMEWVQSGHRLEAATEMEGDERLDGQFAGYTQGVIDTLVRLELLCIPSRISLHQIQAMVVKFAKANPQSRNKPGAEIVYFSLVGSYSCKKK